MQTPESADVSDDLTWGGGEKYSPAGFACQANAGNFAASNLFKI
jgi:hypothetical protein